MNTGWKNSWQYEKKRSEETQTLGAGCSKAEPKIFTPLQTPFPGAWDGQNLISRRWSLSIPTNPVWWGSMHAISSDHGNRLTHTHTHPPTNTQTGPITIHCTAASVQCKYYKGTTVPNRRPLPCWIHHVVWIWLNLQTAVIFDICENYSKCCYLFISQVTPFQ